MSDPPPQRASRRLRRPVPAADPAALIGRFNARVAPPGSVTADIHRGCIRYRIVRLDESIHNQDVYDLVNRLSKVDLSRPAVIDLSACRVVSSIDLSFIGFVLNQTRFHRGKAVIVGANRIVARALAMVGFDRLCRLGGEDDPPLSPGRAPSRGDGSPAR